jgi:hypothetical protein
MSAALPIVLRNADSEVRRLAPCAAVENVRPQAPCDRGARMAARMEREPREQVARRAAARRLDPLAVELEVELTEDAGAWPAPRDREHALRPTHNPWDERLSPGGSSLRNRHGLPEPKDVQDGPVHVGFIDGTRTRDP